MKQGRVRVLALVASDMTCVGVVWTLVTCGYWALGSVGYAPSQYLALWPILIMFPMMNAVAKLYHGNCFYPSAPMGPVEEFRRLVLMSLALHLIVMSILGFAREVNFISRFVLTVSGVCVGIFAQPFRNIIRRLLRRLDVGQIPVVVLGRRDSLRSVGELCEDSTHLGFSVAKTFVLPDYDDVRWDVWVQEVIAVGRRLDVKHVLVCDEVRQEDLLLRELARWYVFVDHTPVACSYPMAGARCFSVGVLAGVEHVNQARMRGVRLTKGLMDWGLAVVGIVLLSPLFVLIPLVIRLTSRGPAFYRHERLGQDGRKIYVWKFRSMYADADSRLADLLAQDPQAREEWTKNFKLRDDPRITAVGRFLRKTSLDELPQLFNVFAGTMAVVGPRPIVPAEVAHYGKDYAVFSRAKPGITGLWQVSGRSDSDYASRVALDCQYVLNWSPWMDLWVLIRTVPAVLFMRGAC